MKKNLITILISSFMAFNASSQTIKDNIDKAVKDKDAKEKSAKADVIILKKNIADTTQNQVHPVKVVSREGSGTKTKKKKNRYKTKYRSSK